MSNYNAYFILIQNSTLYYFYLLICFLLVYILYRKLFFTFLDPLFMGLISSIFSIPVFLTLYTMGYICIDDFFSFLLSEFFLFLGLFISFRVNLRKILVVEYESNEILSKKIKKNSLFIFYFLFFIYITVQLIVYKISGIPLFNKSRLDDFTGGSGYGIFSRFIEISLFFSLIFFYFYVLTNKFNVLKFILPLIMYLIICLTLFLTGSKSAFIIVFQTLLAVAVVLKVNGIRNDIFQRIMKYKIQIVLSLVFGIIFLFYIIDNIQGVENRTFLESLILRFVHFGDIYWYAYPNKAYLSIEKGNWIYAVFNDTLGFFKIISWNKLPAHIGYSLYQIFHPSINIQGANARFNVFGVVYFGHIGSVVYSLIIGLILGLTRRLIFKRTSSILILCCSVFLFIKTYTIFVDLTLFITSMNNLFFIFPFYFVLITLLLKVFKK